MRHSYRIICLVLSLLLLASLLPVSALAGTGDTVVRVGLFPLGQFQYINEDGEPAGYNIDYLNKIAETTRWRYEYVTCANWVEATALLESGQIDLLAPAQNIPALAERFDYCAYNMCVEFAAVYCLEGRDDLVYEDIAAMRTLRYGAAEGSSFAKNFLSWAAGQGFEPQMVYYANTTEQFAALSAGEVDAIVTNIMFWQDGIRTLTRFGPMQVYYITAKGNTALLDQLDDAMYTIQLNDPTFSATLMTEHFPHYKNTQFSFDEYSFIQSLPVLRVGYQTGTPPLAYTGSTGEFEGIERDLLDLVSQLSGITFEYVPLPAGAITVQQLQEMDIHLVAGAEQNAANRALSGMTLSAPYLTSERVIVSRKGLAYDASSAMRMVTATGSATLPGVIADHYPAYTLLVVDSTQAAFDVLTRGDADLLLENRYVVEPWLSKPQYEGLQVVPTDTLTDKKCLAVVDTGDTCEAAQLLRDSRFLSVIDKAIEQIDDVSVRNIIIRRTAENVYVPSAADLVWRYRWPLALSGVLVLVCLLLLLHSQHLKARKNKELSEKNVLLAEAVERADQASRAKSQFLSRMSHEIRTPMNAIVGLTAITRQHVTEPVRVTDALTKIDSSSRLLLSIINDVLDMSAIESDKLKIAHEPFDLKELLSSLTSVYYPQCRQKGVDLEILTAGLRYERLVGDALRVNQVLMNLISNAYKFTGAGGRITVEATERAQSGDRIYLHLRVSDTGCGMTKEMLGRLFHAFEQESATTASKHGGSGLGMAITKQLVNLMQGSVAVQSEKGVGTTFTVDLPFEIDRNAEPMDADSLHAIRALVVDDDPKALEYTALVLSHIGVRFETAASGKEALEKLQAAHDAGDPFDISFVDWRMPDHSGLDVTRDIRARYDTETMIIIVSAYDLSEVQTEAQAAGASMFVSKPLFQSTVFNILMSLSGGRYTKRTADEGSADFSGRTFLLAEDNDLNREIATELLGMVHAQVDCAVNGQEAVDKFSAAPEGTYDLILMDVQMPVMDGYAATRAIRALQRADAATIPILAMTANAFTEDVTMALSAGMNDHIAKPIDTAVMYRTLQKHLSAKG